jgi:competence protein ComGD
MNHSGGFTMVEMLIVLSAFLMLTLTSAFLFSPQKAMLEKDLFFSQLKSDLLYSQQYAISHQETITVHIVPEGNYYYIRGADYAAPYLALRHYSPQIKLKKGTMNLLFNYMPDGNIDSFGSIYVTAGAKKYKLMIQIGKGRFYVLEE